MVEFCAVLAWVLTPSKDMPLACSLTPPSTLAENDCCVALDLAFLPIPCPSLVLLIDFVTFLVLHDPHTVLTFD